MAKYSVLEAELQRINREKIQLNEDEKRRNREMLRDVLREFETEFQKDPFFKSIYQRRFFFGGSFYDNLKVGKPDEFDIDLVFKLPKNANAAILTDDNYPGFVQIHLLQLKMMQNSDLIKYTAMLRLVNDQDYLDIDKIMRWFQSMVDKAKIALEERSIGFSFIRKVVTPGPAITFTICDGRTGSTFDVDFVPCFTFPSSMWPDNCEGKPSPNDVDQLVNEFLVVPKRKDTFSNTYFRLSFQGQERRLLHDHGHIKTAIRLLKFYRNQYNDQIKSYYLKTLGLWALKDTQFRCTNESLSSIFLQLFRKYHAALEQEKLPYFWNRNFNLLEGCHPSHLQNLYHRVGKHLQLLEATQNKEAKEEESRQKIRKVFKLRECDDSGEISTSGHLPHLYPGLQIHSSDNFSDIQPSLDEGTGLGSSAAIWTGRRRRDSSYTEYNADSSQLSGWGTALGVVAIGAVALIALGGVRDSYTRHQPN